MMALRSCWGYISRWQRVTAANVGYDTLCLANGLQSAQKCILSMIDFTGYVVEAALQA